MPFFLSSLSLFVRYIISLLPKDSNTRRREKELLSGSRDRFSSFGRRKMLQGFFHDSWMSSSTSFARLSFNSGLRLYTCIHSPLLPANIPLLIICFHPPGNRYSTYKQRNPCSLRQKERVGKRHEAGKKRKGTDDDDDALLKRRDMHVSKRQEKRVFMTRQTMAIDRGRNGGRKG